MKKITCTGILLSATIIFSCNPNRNERIVENKPHILTDSLVVFSVDSVSTLYMGNPNVRGDAIIDKEYLSDQLGGVPKINKQLFIDFDNDVYIPVKLTTRFRGKLTTRKAGERLYQMR